MNCVLSAIACYIIMRGLQVIFEEQEKKICSVFPGINRDDPVYFLI